MGSLFQPTVLQGSTIAYLNTDWTSSSKHLHQSWNSFPRILPWGNGFDSRRYSWFGGPVRRWWYTQTPCSTCGDSFSVSPATGIVFCVSGMILSYSIVKATRRTHWPSSSFWPVATLQHCRTTQSLPLVSILCSSIFLESCCTYCNTFRCAKNIFGFPLRTNQRQILTQFENAAHSSWLQSITFKAKNVLCSFCTVHFGFASVARIDSILETNVVGTIAFRLDASGHNHESGWYIRTMIGPATGNYIEAWRDWSKLRSGNHVSCQRICTVVLCNSVAWWYLPQQISYVSTVIS